MLTFNKKGSDLNKILYINPIGTDVLDKRFEETLERIARPETEINITSFECLYNKPFTNPFLYIGNIIEAVKNAEKQGYSGVIIGCAADPGLEQAKKAVRIPVTAPAEAGMYLSSLLGRFSIIVPKGGSGDTAYVKDLVRSYGLLHKLVSCALVEIPGRPSIEEEDKEVLKNPKQYAKKISKMFREAVKGEIPNVAQGMRNEGARSILLACTLFSNFQKEIREISHKLGTPIIDPVVASLKVIEMEIEGVSYSMPHLFARVQNDFIIDLNQKSM